jgi:hypothetical protein
MDFIKNKMLKIPLWAKHSKMNLTDFYKKTAPSYVIIDCKLQDIDCTKEGYLFSGIFE